jgi:hypothetical protein
LTGAEARGPTEGIITGVCKGSTGSWREIKRGGHEAEEKDQESDECAPETRGVKRSGIVDGGNAKETHAEKKKSPNVPALPEAEEAKGKKKDRKKHGDEAVERSAERAENVAAVELGDGKKIERGSEKSNPGGAADGMKKKCAGGNAGMQNGDEEAQKEWDAKSEVHVLRVVESGDNFGVQDTVDERGNGKNKADEWAGSADVKEGTGGANRRTNENEGAESADERGKGNEKRITGADVMMAASEEVAEFVREENGEQCESERQAGGESGGVFVKQREGFDKLVQGNGLILCIGDGELSAGDETSAESEEKKDAGEVERLEGRARRG